MFARLRRWWRIHVLGIPAGIVMATELKKDFPDPPPDEDHDPHRVLQHFSDDELMSELTHRGYNGVIHRKDRP